MGRVSFAWGIAAFSLMLAAFMPFLSPINWFNLPFSVLGLAFGAVAVIRPAENKATAIVGLLCCVLGFGIALVRALFGAATF